MAQSDALVAHNNIDNRHKETGSENRIVEAAVEAQYSVEMALNAMN